MNYLFIGNGFDLQHNNGYDIRFSMFVEYIKLNNKHYYKKYFDSNLYKNAFTSELWSEFENYCYQENYLKRKGTFYSKILNLFRKWIDEIKQKIDIKQISPNKCINDILKKYNIESIISFNYTQTPEIYGFKSLFFDFNSTKSTLSLENLNRKYVNIHYFNSNYKEGSNYIIGHDCEKKYHKNFFIQQWKDKKEFNPKKLLFDVINQDNNLKIIFYGFSFGLSDKNTTLFIFNIFKHHVDKIIIYYKDNDSYKSIINNLKQILKGKKGIKSFFNFLEFRKND